MNSIRDKLLDKTSISNGYPRDIQCFSFVLACSLRLDFSLSHLTLCEVAKDLFQRNQIVRVDWSSLLLSSIIRNISTKKETRQSLKCPRYLQYMKPRMPPHKSVLASWVPPCHRLQSPSSPRPRTGSYIGFGTAHAFS